MRLSTKKVEIINTTISKYLGNDVSVYLFGSRVDDTKIGGDIDLYIKKNNCEISTYKRLLTKAKLKEKLLKPVDLIIENTRKVLIDEEALKGILL
ncbi:MAG: nucleotidyltransferase domain-containing protein [Sulfurimonas sp.]|nr:nucleotidyltransferase domain-containing protein [Sulfurimonas sp.]MDQ7062437.1 nucleotidyltransferase domain-containing protein [Sulfurimonas sp.]